MILVHMVPNKGGTYIVINEKNELAPLLYFHLVESLYLLLEAQHATIRAFSNINGFEFRIFFGNLKKKACMNKNESII